MREDHGMLQRSPGVTVIIPTYNSSATLKPALETALQQDYRDIEVWVVGDGCTDDSETVVAAFGDDRVHWLNLPVNSGGPSLPRNQGLDLAKGRYIAYLGHDDLWFPWHLSGLIDCLETTGNDFASSLAAAIGSAGLIDTFIVPRKPWLWRCGLSPSSWMHRSALTDEIGCWSTKVKLGHDTDFLQRVLDAGLPIAFSPHLSVLKFPAEQWRMYSSADVPQEVYHEAMRHDAEGLRVQLLTEAAMLLAREERFGRQSNFGLPGPVAALVRWTCDVYGRNHWPLNQILYRVWRHNAGLGRKKSKGH